MDLSLIGLSKSATLNQRKAIFRCAENADSEL